MYNVQLDKNENSASISKKKKMLQQFHKQQQQTFLTPI